MLKREALPEIDKLYRNYELNSSIMNFYDPMKDEFIEPKSIYEILNHFQFSKPEHYAAFSVEDDGGFQIQINRPSKSCFVNTYFVDGLLALEANLDIQSLLNHYKTITYICTYLSK